MADDPTPADRRVVEPGERRGLEALVEIECVHRTERGQVRAQRADHGVPAQRVRHQAGQAAGAQSLHDLDGGPTGGGERLLDEERFAGRRDRGHDRRVERGRDDGDDRFDARIGDQGLPLGVEPAAEGAGLRRTRRRVAATEGGERQLGDVRVHMLRVTLPVLARSDEPDRDPAHDGSRHR